MNRVRALFLIPSTTLLVLLTVAIAISGVSRGEQVVVDTDWVVDETINESLEGNEYLFRANLTITGTGAIAFERSKLVFLSDEPGRYGIDVMPGGYLLADECEFKAGYLSPGERAEPWTFLVRDSGRLFLKDSTLSGMGVVGGTENQRGLVIKSRNARVDGCIFTDNNRGVLMNWASPTVANNTFTWNNVGMEVTQFDGYLEDHNTYKENAMGVLFTSCIDATLFQGTFVDNTFAVRAVQSKVRVMGVNISGQGDGVSSELHSDMEVYNSTIDSVYGKGKALLHSRLVFIDCDTGPFTGMTQTDLGSSILSRVSVRLSVRWAEVDLPVEHASTMLFDSMGNNVSHQVTMANGLTPYKHIRVFEQEGTSRPIDYQPFKAVATEGHNYVEIEGIQLGPLHVILVEFVDEEPPDLFVSSPADGVVFNTTDLVLRGRVSDIHSGLAELFYTVDGGDPISLPVLDPWQVTEVLPEGNLTLTFVAVDNVGNIDRIERRVTVDVTPPEVTDLDPPEGSVTRAYQLLITGRTEPGALVSIDDVDLEVAENGSFAGYATLGDEEGVQTITIHLSDGAGNSAVQTHTVTVDRTPPVLAVETSPDHRDFSYLNDSLVRVFGTCDPGALVQVLLGSEMVNSTLADEDGRWSVDIHLELGENELLVDAYDDAGNRDSVEVISFLYDVTPPEITILEPASGTVLERDSVYVRVRSEPGAIVWVDEEQEQRQPSHGEVEWDAVPLRSRGNNTIRVYAQDRAGNLAMETVLVVYGPQEDGPDNGTTGLPVWMVVLVVVAVGGAAAVVVWTFKLRT